MSTSAADAAGRLRKPELGVLRLVAQSFRTPRPSPNPPVSEAAIKSHIASILAKLGSRDWVQVAVYAYQHGIVRPGR